MGLPGSKQRRAKQISPHPLYKKTMKLSICIPTYNRVKHLNNCLNSIISNKSVQSLDFQVCISNNCSTDETEKLVKSFSRSIPIKYNKNETNLGVARNVLKVVEMADGEFAWLIGDDDLLMPDAIREMLSLIEGNAEVDFFYINSFHQTAEFVHSFPQPFDTKNLPMDMKAFSPRTKSGPLPFLKLIDPQVSFDFLGGMFLSVFRKKNWTENLDVLNRNALLDSRTFSHFDNTFVHVKVFSKAFADAKAYFHAKPLSVCLTGAREWVPMYSMIRSVRLLEALEEHRKNGLPLLQYLKCRNYALNFFIPDIVYMWIHKKASGWAYISPVSILIKNLIYPNAYLSPVYFIFRKINQFIKSKLLKL